MNFQRVISGCLFTAAAVLLFYVPVRAQNSPVEIWSEPLTIPTYVMGDPQRIPLFYDGRGYQGAMGPVYPSAWYDALGDVKKNVSYKAVYLENDYIRICVLPELDGRIFEAVDKSNGYNLFYRQHVIKYSMIGMHGAWISGGVEWNVPHHHRPSTYSMMDHLLVENPDGSKTVWVGEIEKRHRMRWIIGITLYPDRSYIETTFTLMNRTPLVHSFLYFQNPAVHVDSTYQVLFPPGTEFVTQHAKREFASWPIANERYGGFKYDNVDISWWKNLPVPVSFFCWNYEADFLGGYNHGKDAGVTYVADHHIAPGKKFFSFGNGPQGQMWDKILTDADGPYLELMTGSYSDNQPDYSWAQPYEVKTVKQYWYPIKKLQGLKYANIEGAVNLTVSPGHVADIRLNTTTERRGATLALLTGGRVLLEEKIDIGPDKPYRSEILLPETILEESLLLTLTSAEGKELISYRPVTKPGRPMPAPVEPPPAPETIKSNDELYLAGLRLDQFYNTRLDPYAYYREALKRDPGDSRVNTQLGINYLKQGMYREAEKYLRAAVDRVTANYTSPKDGEPLYYLAEALRKQGKFGEAYDLFYKATWSSAWHTAAYYVLAELDCRNGDYRAALEHIDRSLSTNINSVSGLNLKASILRKLQRYEPAERQAQMVLEIDPLNFRARYEMNLLRALRNSGSIAEKQNEKFGINEIDDIQSYIELAVEYANCGMWDEAENVLSRLDVSKNSEGSTYPMLYYYIGYCRAQTGDLKSAADYYRKAETMPPDCCFPSRYEAIDVLEDAMRLNPEGSFAPYYLGNLLYDWQPERAVELWEKAKNLGNIYYVLYRNLGYAAQILESDLDKAIAYYKDAIRLNNRDPRLFFEIDRLSEAANVPPQDRLKLLGDNLATVRQADNAYYRKAMVHVGLGEFDAALDILENRHFHLFAEEGSSIHKTYVDAHILRGLSHFDNKRYDNALKDFEAALEYPDNLEVGQPDSDARFSQINFLIGTVYEARGENDRAMIYYEKAAAEDARFSPYVYYKGRALEKLGRSAEAATLYEGLVQSGTRMLNAGASQDFFAKFSERQARSVTEANGHFLCALGYMGQGKPVSARTELEKAMKLKADFAEAKYFLDVLKQ